MYKHTASRSTLLTHVEYNASGITGTIQCISTYGTCVQLCTCIQHTMITHMKDCSEGHWFSVPENCRHIPDWACARQYKTDMFETTCLPVCKRKVNWTGTLGACKQHGLHTDMEHYQWCSSCNMRLYTLCAFACLVAYAKLYVVQWPSIIPSAVYIADLCSHMQGGADATW